MFGIFFVVHYLKLLQISVSVNLPNVHRSHQTLIVNNADMRWHDIRQSLNDEPPVRRADFLVVGQRLIPGVEFIYASPFVRYSRFKCGPMVNLWGIGARYFSIMVLPRSMDGPQLESSDLRLIYYASQACRSNDREDYYSRPG